MKYKIAKETNPTLSTFGKYKAKAVRYETIETRQLSTCERPQSHQPACSWSRHL